MVMAWLALASNRNSDVEYVIRSWRSKLCQRSEISREPVGVEIAARPGAFLVA